MKKNKLIIFFTIFIIITNLFTFVFTYKFKDDIKELKKSLTSKSVNIYENSDLIKDLPSIEYEKDAWYTKYHFIAHSGGGIDGKLYSNSKEAWNLSYKNGSRVFDADLRFTNDGKLVLRHEENDNLELDNTLMKDSNIFINRLKLMQYRIKDVKMKFEKYMNSKIYSKYTPMSLEDMLMYMNEHPDVYVIVDMKDDIYKSYEYFINCVNENNLQNILDRIIVGVYNQETIDIVKELYDFKQFTIKEYSNNVMSYYDIVNMCISNNIHVVNISQEYINDVDDISLLTSKGICVYVAVVDYISDMRFYFNSGVNGAVTNWLYENDWNKYINVN